MFHELFTNVERETEISGDSDGPKNLYNQNLRVSHNPLTIIFTNRFQGHYIYKWPVKPKSG